MQGVRDLEREGSATADPFGALVGESEALSRLRRHLRVVAATDSTVLLTGETGTGKGLLARLLHEGSRRARGPLVHVDCAALAPTVIESELFGHERGAFTGADVAREGRLEAAARGTLFLDEIGELDPRLQAKLLRALQERAFERVGASRTLPMTARVVAATNRELRAAVASGRFRADLYFRLHVLELRLPPLRERLDDLPLLVAHGLREIGPRLGRPVPATSESFQRALRAHAWPGNVRELLNLLERLLVQYEGATLDADALAGALDPWPAGAPGLFRAVHDGEDAARGERSEPERSEGGVRTRGERSEPERSEGGVRARGESEHSERERIATVLRSTGGNVARAARRLGIARSTLRHRIERFGLRELIPDD